jgi:hypothetical protein
VADRDARAALLQHRVTPDSDIRTADGEIESRQTSAMPLMPMPDADEVPLRPNMAPSTNVPRR